MTDAEKTGALIAALRKQKELTQAQLAAQLGVTNKAVSKWETGAGIPDLSILPTLCSVLGITADALLRGVAPCEEAMPVDASRQNIVSATQETPAQGRLSQSHTAQDMAGAPSAPLFCLPFARSVQSIVCFYAALRHLRPRKKVLTFCCTFLLIAMYAVCLGNLLARGQNSWAMVFFSLGATLLVLDLMWCGYSIATVAFLWLRKKSMPTLSFFADNCRIQRADSLTIHDYKALRTVFYHESCLIWNFDGALVATQRPDASTLAAILSHLRAREAAASACEAGVEANPTAARSFSIVNEPRAKHSTRLAVASSVCVLLFAGVSLLRLQGVCVSLSPQGKAAFVRIDPETGQASWFRFFGKQSDTFAYAVLPDSPLKFQWLTPDACAVTYLGKADKLAHQSVITFGDRGNGSYNTMTASLRGLWAREDKVCFLYLGFDAMLVEYRGRIYTYTVSDCVQFGTIAAVLCYEGTPQFTVVLGEDYVRAENGSASCGSIVLCPVSMEATAPVKAFYKEISS